MTTNSQYLRNTWYMLAWSSELSDKPMTRTILGSPVVAFRLPDAGIAALHDRCPHRFAPLSLGQVVEDNIECPYHGLQFNSKGECQVNPHSKAIPAAAKVTSYSVAEQDGVIWIWIGEGTPDHARIPRVEHQQGTHGLEWVSGVTVAKADYRLLSDNLMDLTHTMMLHPALGGRGYRANVKSWEDAAGDVIAQFVVPNIDNFYGEEVIPGAKICHRDTIRWSAPSFHILKSCTGPQNSEEIVVSVSSAHILTPETETTTHYFWSSEVPAGVDAAMAREILMQAFDREDKPMVEAVQKSMGGADLWDLHPVLLSSDAGGVRMRRKLAALIKDGQPE